METGEYVCLSCGERFEEHDPPCSACAGEEFAAVVESGEDRIEDVAAVRFRCADCGRVHPRNAPPCKQCGGMDFQTVRDAPATGDGEQSDDDRETSLGALGNVAAGSLVPFGAVLAIFSRALGIATILIGIAALPAVRQRVVIDPRERPETASTVTALGVVANLVAGGLIILGVLYARLYVVPGGVLVASGLFALPAIRRTIASRLGIAFSRGATVLIVTLLVGFGFVLLASA